VAVELATQLFADITSAGIVVIGAGEMGELLLQHLRHAKCSDITIVNRSLRRAEEMAGRYGVEAGKWQDLGSRIKDADIIIASAAGQDYLFGKDSFRKMMGARRKGALLVIDIAVPRNFEPTVNEIENVYLYSVDDLSEVAEENRKAREDNIAKGMQIIYENAVDFMDWFRGRDIGPLLGKMREKFVRLSEDELERFFAGSRQEALSRNALEPVVKRIVNKLVHCIIKNVDTVAKEHGPAEAAKLIDNIIKDAEEVLSKPGNKEDMQS
jgi:glutamyl-tRNA reductase